MEFLGGWRGARAILFLAGLAQLCSLGAIRFETNPFEGREGDAAVELTIRREDVGAALAVDWRINFNSVEATADFEAPSGRVEFAADQPVATFTVRPRRDGIVEGLELFEL